MGLLIALGVVLAALWLVAAYGFYKESERAKYDIHISPGAVTYGTHSTALMPVSVAPLRHSLPMISGAAVRSYAHGGHATMSSAGSSNGQLHTTSSATVKSIGSGAGNSGMYTSTGSSSHRADRGITYGGGSVSMPSIAMLTTSSMVSPSKAPNAIGARRTKWSTPNPGSGDEGDWYDGGSDGWWVKEGGVWRTPEYGDTRYDMDLDYVVVWNGSGWVKYEESEFVPVGPMPWIFIFLLAIGYIGMKRRKRNFAA